MKYQTYEVRHIRDIRDMLRSSTDMYAEKNVFLQKMDGEYKGITYATLRHDVEALGTALWAEGLAGKRIMVIGESCYNWCMSYLAVICGLGVIEYCGRRLQAYIPDGFVTFDGDRYAFTPKGMYVSNYILSSVLPMEYAQ